MTLSAPRSGNDRPRGLYDELVTSRVEAELRRLMDQPEYAVDLSPIGDAEAPEVLSRHIQRQARAALARLKEGDRSALTNQVLLALSREGEDVPQNLQRLLALRDADGTFATHPVLPVGELALLTNSPDEPTVGHEIRGELASANSVRLICAFIKWYGLRTLEQPLRALAERGVPSVSSPPRTWGQPTELLSIASSETSARR